MSRALHYVSTTTGPPEQPKHDVIFSAGECVGVVLGIVDKILQRVKPIAEYQRRGNLYSPEITSASFHGQGQADQPFGCPPCKHL